MGVNPDGHEVEVITGRRRRGASRPGESNPNASLSSQDVRSLRMMRQNGWSHGDLARMFGVSVGRSSEICRGRAYPGAGGPVEQGARVYNLAMDRVMSSADARSLRERVLDLYGQGLSQRAIAASVGRSKTYVGDVIREWKASHAA